METKILLKIKNKKQNIIIGKNSLKRINKYISIKKNLLNIVIIDSKVFKIHKSYINKNFNISNAKIIVFKSLEKDKSISGYNKLIKKIFRYKPDRNSRIIIIGGGMLGDLGGFICSTILRGLDLTLVPTTLLSQVDSSIGGKNGINNEFGKNLIGTFYQPSLVIIDTYFLKSLPKKQIISGYSEIIKHALIKNKKYFYWLEKNSKNILSLKEPFLSKAIIESIKIKSQIVKNDEKENLNNKNSRALLNFGHTIGHALEAKNNYKNNLTHGEAISIGMVCATKISNKLNFLSKEKEEEIIKNLKESKLPININKINLDNLFKYILQDKKISGNKIKFVLLKDIGKAFIIKNFTFKKLKNIFAQIYK